MYFLNPRLAADVFDGEYIIANLDTGLYYSVQGLAVSLIDALPFQEADSVVRSLVDVFPEIEGDIEGELVAILNELISEEVIKQDNNVVSASPANFNLPNEYVPSRFNRYADMKDLLLLDPIHDVDEEGWTVQNEKD